MSGEGEVIFKGSPSCLIAPGAWCRRTNYLITSKFIEVEKGICCRNILNVQIMKIKDLHYEQCCCCTCGTITIYAVDNDTPVLYISGIPGGREVFDKLRDSWNATNANARLQLDV